MIKYQHFKKNVYSYALNLAERHVEQHGVKGCLSLDDLCPSDLREFASLLLTHDREMDFLANYYKLIPLIQNSLKGADLDDKLDLANSINQMAVDYFKPEMEEILNYAHLEAVNTYISENNLRTGRCEETGERLFFF